MSDERVAPPRPSEEPREYARRIVRAHQHGHGSKDPAKCPYCRNLIDVITLALTTATAALREENERLRWECDSVAFELEGWKQKNRQDNEYLIADRDRLRAALEASRGQWIHSVNGAQCLAALATGNNG